MAKKTLLGKYRQAKKNILARWKAETPKVYKKVRNTAFAATFIIPIVGGVGDKYPWMQVPKWFTENSWYLMTASAAITAGSQLTRKKDDNGDVILSAPDKKDEKANTDEIALKADKTALDESSKKIDDEIAKATAAETALSTKIDTEVTDR